MTNVLTPQLVLASASISRARLLTAAGIAFVVQPAHVDEEAIKTSLRAEGASAIACAESLAELKAVKVSQSLPGVLVIGADQMLECAGVWFDKPKTLDDARTTLRALSGKTHVLPTAVVVARDGARVWHHLSAPRLIMRPLSQAATEIYLAQVGSAVSTSVGAYHLEGLGAQLFSVVEGDFFSILGLPLVPLLGFLRGHGIGLP